jgi:hypothetical protein
MKKAPRKIIAFFQNNPAGRSRAHKSRGQSLVEIAIAFPIIIMLLSGLVEFGFMLNYYLSLLDATREAARTFSNFDPFEDGYSLTPPDCTCDTATACLPDNNANCIANCVADRNDSDCDRTSFYKGAEGMVLDNLQPRGGTPEERRTDSSRRIFLDSATDDVVVSVFSVGPNFIWRFPEDGGQDHWYNNQPSRLSTEEIHNRLIGGAPDTGILLVEVFFNYHQVLALPWLAPFLPDPIMLHAYTIMPCPAAEPH